MRIAVTGANSFVGSYLINRLLERGDEVISVEWFLNPFQGPVDPRLTLHNTDFSREDLRETFNGVDSIVHLAAMRTNASADAQGFHPYYEANVRNTENIILAAQDNHIQLICQASSIAVYSLENKVPYQESDAPVPLSLYGISKLACEHLASIYMRQFPIKIVSLRFAQIFGYGEIRGLAITKFIELARSGQPINIWGEGVTARDYVYVKDVVTAIEQAITPNAFRGVYNIGSGHPLSVREVAETVKDVFNNTINLVFDLSKTEPGDVYFMDCSYTRQVLNWQPQWKFRMALEDMKLFYDWK